MKTDQLITFSMDDFVEDIREVMASKRHRDFPILDDNGSYRGMISRRNLLGMKRKQVILVDHNERGQAVDGIENAEILEDHRSSPPWHHRDDVPGIFPNQPLGCTATIVYQMYREAGIPIENEIAEPSLLLQYIRYPRCTARPPVRRWTGQAAEDLAKTAGGIPRSWRRKCFPQEATCCPNREKEVSIVDYKGVYRGQRTLGIGPDQLHEYG